MARRALPLSPRSGHSLRHNVRTPRWPRHRPSGTTHRRSVPPVRQRSASVTTGRSLDAVVRIRQSHVAGPVHPVVRPVPGYRMFLTEPGAEVKQPAALAAEWSPDRRRGPDHRIPTGGATDSRSRGIVAHRSCASSRQAGSRRRQSPGPGGRRYPPSYKTAP